MSINPAALAAQLNPESKAMAKNKDKGANGKPPIELVENPVDQLKLEPAIVRIELPIRACQAGHASPRVDFHATPRQAAALKILWCSLSEAGARFQGGRSLRVDGTPVECANDAVRYILDLVADGIEEGTGKKLLDDFALSFR